MNLGSDHDIIHLFIRNKNYKAHIGSTRITNWDAFRKAFKNPPEPNQPFAEWIDSLLHEVKAHTQTIAATYQTPSVDAKLLHMWAARHSLTRRWKRQRHNRKIRKKIAILTQQAAEYAQLLSKENWLQICDSLQGTLTTRKTWHLLRHLIDPIRSKGESNRNTARTLHAYPGASDQLIQDLQNKYLQTEIIASPPPYTGNPNENLDRDIQSYELQAAIAECKKHSAPGPDQITYRILANLGDDALATLLAHFNEFWSTGKIPDQWKTAEARFIPKPGKSPHIENLRPISLTSCVGKILERIVLKRLQQYLEDTKQIPDTMFGFRQNLSTQDVLLQIKEEIIAPATCHSPRAILALDLKGAFDNVTHAAILGNLNQTGCGKRAYNYIADFLTGRQAILKIGDIKSKPIGLGSRGTPQGSVLTPAFLGRLPWSAGEARGDTQPTACLIRR